MILWKDGADGGPGTGNKFNVTGLYRKQGKGRFSLLFPIAHDSVNCGASAVSTCAASVPGDVTSSLERKWKQVTCPRGGGV